MQEERLKSVEECNRNKCPFPQKIKACLAIPLQMGRAGYKKWIVKIIAQCMKCRGRGWDWDWAVPGLLLLNGAFLPLPETSEKSFCQATEVSLLPNKLQMPQERSFCKQYLLLDINTYFQSLKFISARMMFMTLGLVILSWILSAKETGLAHGSRHLWLWSEPLFRVLRTDGTDLPTGGWAPREQEGHGTGRKDTLDQGQDAK